MHQKTLFVDFMGAVRVGNNFVDPTAQRTASKLRFGRGNKAGWTIVVSVLLCVALTLHRQRTRADSSHASSTCFTRTSVSIRTNTPSHSLLACPLAVLSNRRRLPSPLRTAPSPTASMHVPRSRKVFDPSGARVHATV